MTNRHQHSTMWIKHIEETIEGTLKVCFFFPRPRTNFNHFPAKLPGYITIITETRTSQPSSQEEINYAWTVDVSFVIKWRVNSLCNQVCVGDYSKTTTSKNIPSIAMRNGEKEESLLNSNSCINSYENIYPFRTAHNLIIPSKGQRNNLQINSFVVLRYSTEYRSLWGGWNS